MTVSPRQDDDAATPPEWFRWALDQPGESRRVEVDGVSLHYLGWSLADTAKPVLLLVHGQRSHARWWDFIAPFFAADYRVIALDLSGMGDSDARSTYRPGQGAHDIVALLRALELESVVAVGHSMGGVRLLRACADAPELFERLVIIDSYVVFADGNHPSDPPGLRGNRIYPDLETALGRYRLLPEQPGNLPYALAHIARHAVRQTESGWRWKFDPDMPGGLAYEEDGDVFLPEVTKPVCVVYGEASAVGDAALAQRIVRKLPRGQGPIGVPGGHHHLMIDQPVALIALLRALLLR